MKQFAGNEGPENRRAVRRLVHKRFTIHLLYAGARIPMKAVLMDISTLGVGLLHAGQVSHGQEFMLPITAEDGSRRWLLYRVIQCRRATEGNFKTGAQFVRRVPDGADGFGSSQNSARAPHGRTERRRTALVG